MSNEKIAQKMGINRVTLSNWRKLCQAGYKRIRLNWTEKFEQKRKVDLDAKIAEEFGVSHWTIYNWKKAFGLNTKWLFIC
uniref:Helix-turn-helix domain-containing protein n=1 Tax=Globodera pallida TaxID=36090 RepID=A0A183BS38_GLOPA